MHPIRRGIQARSSVTVRPNCHSRRTRSASRLRSRIPGRGRKNWACFAPEQLLLIHHRNHVDSNVKISIIRRCAIYSRQGLSGALFASTSEAFKLRKAIPRELVIVVAVKVVPGEAGSMLHTKHRSNSPTRSQSQTHPLSRNPLSCRKEQDKCYTPYNKPRQPLNLVRRVGRFARLADLITVPPTSRSTPLGWQ